MFGRLAELCCATIWLQQAIIARDKSEIVDKNFLIERYRIFVVLFVLVVLKA
jgi:hypothetical protein